VLTKVLRPRPNEERFDVAIRVFEIPIDAPPEGTIPTANAAVLVDRLEKRLELSRLNAVFRGDEHRALVKVPAEDPWTTAGMRHDSMGSRLWSRPATWPRVRAPSSPRCRGRPTTAPAECPLARLARPTARFPRPDRPETPA